MKTTQVCCDRCGSIILGGHSTLHLDHGELATRHDEALDLCESCSDRFGDWLRGGHQNGGRGDGG